MSVDTALAKSENHAFSPCIVIPCFNHGAMMSRVLERLAPYHFPCFIVDDGSDAATQQQLEALVTGSDSLHLLRLPVNQGKGQAVIAGLRAAAREGYTHVIQVDADGQHQIEDIPQFLELAQQYPHSLISGRPIYDESVPKSRLYGRYITHFWVWVETLSLSLKDSMCGFRVYPISETLALANRCVLGSRMDFDTEVMVRLYWDGVNSHFIPTHVTYPVDGLSHFNALWDNCQISWMHTRLVFGMLLRLPRLLKRKLAPRGDHEERHWAGVNERKGMYGMRFMLSVYRLLGRRIFNLLLWPVIGYFWLTGRTQRQASEAYLAQLQHFAKSKGIALPVPVSSFRHFMRFGEAMLDKLASWQGDIRWGKEIDFAPDAEHALNHDIERGTLILASHLGDIEVSRALVSYNGKVKINALVFSEHAQRFKQLMEEVNPQAGINLIPVNNIGPETAILLKERLDAGEWVAIVGDRTAINEQRGGERRVVWSDFLGRAAPFPQGPFVLAAALRCPVKLMFVLREQKTLRIHVEPFADPILLPRKERQQALQQTVDRYAERLGHYALMSPLDWFNFFDFWQLPIETPTEKN